MNEWKVVPVEPTPKMVAAYSAAAEDLIKRHHLSGSYPATWQLIEAGYAAMLRSAPTPPAQDDEALKPDMQSAWISVQDRMPPDDTPVLVYVPGNEMLAFAIDQWQMQREAPLGWSSATIETGMGWGDHDYEDVSHWMPLTAPGHPLDPDDQGIVRQRIRALLDRLDDFEENGAQAVRWAPSSAHWSNELRRLFGPSAREGIESLEAKLRDATVRLDKAERENERLRAENEKLAADARRYQWLTDDHPRHETRSRVYEVASNMTVRGKGATDAAIDAARAAEQSEK